MRSDQELSAEIARQTQRLASQLAELRRDLESRCRADGQAQVQTACEALDQLLGDLR